MVNKGDKVMKLHNNRLKVQVKSMISCLIKDIMIITLGLMISSLGTAIFYAAGLGSSPMATFSDGLHLVLKVSYGTANMIANLVLLAVLFAIQRSYVKVGTLLCVFTIGPWINLFTLLLSGMQISAWPIGLRVACTVLGTGLMGVGLGLYVAVNRGFGALEGLVKYACSKKGISYSLAKILQDTLLVGAGIALGAAWGLGTLLAIIFTGPTIQWSIKSFSKWLTTKEEA